MIRSCFRKLCKYIHESFFNDLKCEKLNIYLLIKLYSLHIDVNVFLLKIKSLEIFVPHLKLLNIYGNKKS
jgi:hypothetical protein